MNSIRRLVDEIGQVTIDNLTKYINKRGINGNAQLK